MDQTMEESLMSRDTVIFLLQHLGFFKPGEVHFESISGNRVLWGSNKFFEDVSVFTTRECVENSESMSGYLCQRSGDSSRTSKVVRSSCLNNLGRFCQLR